MKTGILFIFRAICLAHGGIMSCDDNDIAEVYQEARVLLTNLRNCKIPLDRIRRCCLQYLVVEKVCLRFQ